jgi:hypothetical protein
MRCSAARRQSIRTLSEELPMARFASSLSPLLGVARRDLGFYANEFVKHRSFEGFKQFGDAQQDRTTDSSSRVVAQLRR